jgi:hypothetical protein
MAEHLQWVVFQSSVVAQVAALGLVLAVLAVVVLTGPVVLAVAVVAWAASLQDQGIQPAHRAVMV